MNALVKIGLVLITIAHLAAAVYVAMHFMSAYPGLSIDELPGLYLLAQTGTWISLCAGFYLCAAAFGKTVKARWTVLTLTIAALLIATF